MKKILAFMSGILITCAVFNSCERIRPIGKEEVINPICNDYSNAPVNLMDKKLVIDMVRNYYRQQYQAIHYTGGGVSPLVNFPSDIDVDSRVVFFSLDTLKRLIYNIERASRQFSPADRQNMGINVYFASYTEGMQMKHAGYDYTNRHTLVFIPSVFNNTANVAQDFDLTPALSGANPFTPSYITDVFLNNPGILYIPGMAVLNSSPPGSPGVNAQNHGTATPPPPSPTANPLLDLTDPN